MDAKLGLYAMVPGVVSAVPILKYTLDMSALASNIATSMAAAPIELEQGTLLCRSGDQPDTPAAQGFGQFEPLGAIRTKPISAFQNLGTVPDSSRNRTLCAL